MDETRVFSDKSLEDLWRLIRGVVINDNDVELEIGLLGQGALHRSPNGLLPVSGGDDNTRRLGQDAARNLFEAGFEERSYPPQMSGQGPLHFNLGLPVSRTEIVKESLISCLGFRSESGAEELGYPHNL